MKFKTPGWNRCIAVVHDFHRLVAFAVVAPLCLVSVTVSAADGRMSFSGHISNPTCAVLQSADAQTLQDTRRVQVDGHMSIVVGTAHNACGEAFMPFSTRFDPLTVALSTRATLDQISPEAGAGILTLIYQ